MKKNGEKKGKICFRKNFEAIYALKMEIVKEVFVKVEPKFIRSKA